MQAPLKLFFSPGSCLRTSVRGVRCSRRPAEKKAPAKVGAPKPPQPKSAQPKPAEAKQKAAATTAAAPGYRARASASRQGEPCASTVAGGGAAYRPLRRRHRRNAQSSGERGRRGRIRDAVKAIAEADLAKGKALRDQITDPAGRKLIDWYLYRGGYGTAAEIRAFMLANPAWPDRERLNQRAEEALFNSSASPREIKAFFAETPARHGRRHGRAGVRACRRKGRGRSQGAGRQGLGRVRHPRRPGAEFPQEGRLPAHRERPQAPPRPPAAQRQPLGRRTQRTRSRHPPGHPAAVRARAEEGAGAPRGVPARQEFRATDGQAAAARAQDRMGPCHPAGASAAPAEEARGGVGDPAEGARLHAAREARRLVGGAARQRLRRAQGRQGEDRL